MSFRKAEISEDRIYLSILLESLHSENVLHILANSGQKFAYWNICIYELTFLI